jgi:multiple sugar transport system permease protein
MKRKKNIKKLGIYFALVLSLIIILTPIYWVASTSVKTQRDAFATPPKWVNFQPTLRNYASLIIEGKFFHFFLNSFIVSIGTMFISLICGVPTAYAFSRLNFRGKTGLFFWILFTRIAPPMGFALPFFLIYRDLRLLDTRVGLIIVYLTFNLSLVIWMMSTFFKDIPREIEDAAKVDGASIVKVFTSIILPLSAPSLATVAIFSFLFSWNEFLYALVLTRTNSRTAPVMVISFLTRVGIGWGEISAGMVLLIIPVVAFSFVTRKYLVKGLLGGAVKG